MEQYYDVFENFQSKNLTYYNNNDSEYMESIHLGWPENGVPTIQSFLFSDKFKFKVDQIILIFIYNLNNFFILFELSF